MFLAIKTSSQNISITLLQISLKPHEHWGGYWRKKLPWTTLEEQFPVPRYIAVSKIGNSVISLLWQPRCRCNPDHNKFSSLSNTTVVAIFPNLRLWRRSLCSNLGGIDPEKLYRATLIHSTDLLTHYKAFSWRIRLFTCILRRSSFLQNFLFNSCQSVKIYKLPLHTITVFQKVFAQLSAIFWINIKIQSNIEYIHTWQYYQRHHWKFE